MSQTSPSPEKIIRVALVEDHGGLRSSMEQTLNQAKGICCVAACANAEQALEKIPALLPHVVLMDINLPKMSGVDCVPLLLEKLPSVLVVMLTVYDNTEAIFNSLKSGACGYLQKPVRGNELITAIRDVVAGGSPMSAKIARMVVQTFNPSPNATPKSDTKVTLTDRERAVLDLILEGFLYKQIAEQLSLSVYTVNFHIRNIFEKLQVHSRAEIMAKMRK